VVLLTVFVLQMVLACALKSPTFDETGDIAAGVSYLQTRSVWLNLQHPPLLKELIGFPVWASGAILTADEIAQGQERKAGARLIQANGIDGTMWLARLPMIAVSTMLAALVFLWGRELVGARAALCALFLLVLDPTMVAHSYLATTDVGFAAFAMLFMWVLWRRSHWAVCGAAMGLMLATKFTAGIVVLVAIGLMLTEGRKVKEVARELVLMGLVAGVVLQIFYFSADGLYLYTAGMQRVNQDHNPDYLVYLAGQFAHNFPGYFAAAWLLKSPLAAIVAAFAGLWFVLRSKMDRRAKLYLLVPPAALFLSYSFLADDLGIRYMIPVIPFVCLLGGVGLARLPRAAAAVLGVWVLVAAVGIWPDHLSYFNESACLLKEPSKIGLDGGSRCGIYWLDDSNIDWGQGYKQLKRWADEHAPGRTVNLLGFSSFPGSAYGFHDVRFDELPEKAQPGLWAVTAHFVARDQAPWLRMLQPAAIVGHSIYVYDVK
jgi:hypothetical protein